MISRGNVSYVDKHKLSEDNAVFCIYFTQRIKHFYYWRGDTFLRNCIIFMQHENVTYVFVNFVRQSQSRKKFADKTVTLPTHNENVSYISWDTQCWRTEDTSKSFALLSTTITLHNNRKITMTKHHVISYVSRFHQRLQNTNTKHD